MSILSSPRASQSDPRSAVDAGHGGGGRPKRRPCGVGRFLDDCVRRAVFRRLKEVSSGQLGIVERGARRTFGTPDPEQFTAEIHVRDSRFYRRLAFGGSLGAAEAYLLGYWDCDHLVELMRLFCRNAAISGGFEGGLARLARPVRRMAHRLRRNTTGGSRRNIAAHYDLGEDFFSLFLDETMAYSCGIFPQPDSTLHEASVAKFDRVCRKLQLTDKDHVVEIGSGWGGFAVYAVQHYGCRVTTTTISRRQYEFTLGRIRAAGLHNRVTVLGEDYRNLRGTYDKLVSIEMIEAVGHEYLDAYFRACSDLLQPEGMMLLQAITIPDQRFDRYRRSVDFIQRYVFPGGCLPSLGAVCGSVGRATDLRLVHLEDLTAHYAETLAHWRRRFRANLDQARSLGCSRQFLRLWEFYFCYCEAGFRERMIGDAQLLLCKPRCRRAAILPVLD